MTCCVVLRGVGLEIKLKLRLRIRERVLSKFVGKEQRIAYAKRKCHSGLLCVGVLRGLAGYSCLSPRRSRMGRELSIIGLAL